MLCLSLALAAVLVIAQAVPHPPEQDLSAPIRPRADGCKHDLTIAVITTGAPSVGTPQSTILAQSRPATITLLNILPPGVSIAAVPTGELSFTGTAQPAGTVPVINPAA